MKTRDEALDVIHQICSRTGLSVGTAESLTGGGIAMALTERSGSSAYFNGGVVAYDLASKVTLLHVDRARAEQCNCVDPTIALQMAMGALAVLRVDVAIAVTGYAEPCPEQYIPVPFAHYAVVFRYDRSRHRHAHSLLGTVPAPGLDRKAVRSKVVTDVLIALAEALIDHERQ